MVNLSPQSNTLQNLLVTGATTGNNVTSGGNDTVNAKNEKYSRISSHGDSKNSCESRQKNDERKSKSPPSDVAKLPRAVAQW